MIRHSKLALFKLCSFNAAGLCDKSASASFLQLSAIKESVPHLKCHLNHRQVISTFNFFLFLESAGSGTTKLCTVLKERARQRLSE